MSTPSTLHSAISESIGFLNELIQLLHEERSAMEARDAVTMQMMLPQKSLLLDELQRGSESRSAFLAEKGFTEDEAGLLEYLTTLPAEDTKQIHTDWEILKAKLEECKAANAVNSKIVHRSKHHIEHLLNLMRGQEGSAKVYTQAGNERSINQNQPLAEA